MACREVSFVRIVNVLAGFPELDSLIDESKFEFRPGRVVQLILIFDVRLGSSVLPDFFGGIVVMRQSKPRSQNQC